MIDRVFSNPPVPRAAFWHRETDAGIILLEACGRERTCAGRQKRTTGRGTGERRRSRETDGRGGGRAAAKKRKGGKKKRKEIAKWKVAGHRYWPAKNAPPRGAICKRRFKTGYLRFAHSTPDSRVHAQTHTHTHSASVASRGFTVSSMLATLGPRIWTRADVGKKSSSTGLLGCATCNQAGTKARKQSERASHRLIRIYI